MVRSSGNSALTGKDYRLPKLESYLESTFFPISPNPDFVTGLKLRLSDQSYVHQDQISNLKFGLLVLMAFLFSILVVLGVVRAFIWIVSSRAEESDGS